MPDEQRFDLDAYLDRIGWRGARSADLATLRGVHRAHLLSLPFENLDPLRGAVPSLELDDLTAKLVHGRRGGYCFEHNLLLAGALRALGFGVTVLSGRVVVGAERLESRPRAHALLLVRAADDPRPHLGDVGFGNLGAMVEPVPLVPDVEFRADGRRHRLVQVPHDGPLPQWVLQAWREDDWAAQLAFTEEPFALSDLVTQNWYAATYSDSPFIRRPIVQRTLSARHLLLDGRELTETARDGTVTRRELADEGEVRRVLVGEFGIDVPEGMALLP
ncbi:N-hydroxyarylamine O-acetyltransferase [Streptomyces zhaozhouensis]|uniref:N-hydroxyarylamine O-acetyltransferase n=1 Tax=Streptomyces zhaozhouensis TaxID=1300267 RepID=A0A286E0H2_9ACTN|nr:arylamine N-acetyltransferase [Streptomyces zhaozhouensis]SOD64418.1 N-hydroxyarylamine O-acetyltransferase [Streptomyces zhaozhouensis]